MASEEEVDDYMSDAILGKCPDKRPGLVSERVAKIHKQQKQEQAANSKSKQKPVKVIESQKREEGLKTAISSDNKGFALLQKMGYKPGTAIGKRGQGRSEPVPIELKDGRGGLGKASEMKRKQEDMDRMRLAMRAKRAKHEKHSQQDFRSRIANQYQDRRAESDLHNSQKVCAQLDSQKGIEKPSEVYFWPSYMLPNKEKTKPEDESGWFAYEPEESDEDEEVVDNSDNFTAAEKLEILTLYLRNFHLYCVWCGTTYNDKNDLRSNCPGNTADAHD